MNVKITHIGVYVSDLEKARDYYIKYFGGISNEKYTNAKGFQSYFLTFENEARLELMTHVNLEIRTALEKASGLHHLAFSVGSVEAVNQLTGQIVADGYELYSPPRKTGDGYYESCVSDTEGNRVEITV